MKKHLFLIGSLTLAFTSVFLLDGKTADAISVGARADNGFERTNFGETFSGRSPEPVRDVRRRERQNDVLWARQEMSWLP
jgi:hypothetical protein